MAKKDNFSSYSSEFPRPGSRVYNRMLADKRTREKDLKRFQNNQEFTRLISYLAELRETEFGELTVNYIDLVNAHLSGRYPTLKTIHAFKLR